MILKRTYHKFSSVTALRKFIHCCIVICGGKKLKQDIQLVKKVINDTKKTYHKLCNHPSSHHHIITSAHHHSRGMMLKQNIQLAKKVINDTKKHTICCPIIYCCIVTSSHCHFITLGGMMVKWNVVQSSIITSSHHHIVALGGMMLKQNIQLVKKVINDIKKHTICCPIIHCCIITSPHCCFVPLGGMMLKQNIQLVKRVINHLE